MNLCIHASVGLLGANIGEYIDTQASMYVFG